MAYETFPIETVGYPSRMRVKDLAPVYSTPYEGYEQTGMAVTRIRKEFEVTYERMESDQWIALVEFYHTVHGGADAFYWQFPIGVYGSESGYGMGGYGEGGYGEGGYGEGPVFLVRFVGDELEQEYSTEYDRWAVRTVLREV